MTLDAIYMRDGSPAVAVSVTPLQPDGEDLAAEFVDAIDDVADREGVIPQ